MELYTLNPTDLRRQEVFDRFESLIWTERFSSSGDFELVTYADTRARKLLKPGTMVTVNNSYRVGTVEQVEDKKDSEGRSLLSIKGPHLESILKDRTTRGAGGSTGGDQSKWTFTNLTPTTIVRNIYNSICAVNTPIPADRIPLYAGVNTSLYSADTLAEPVDIIPTFEVPTTDIYSVFTQLADTYGFGFRLYRGLDNGRLYFNVYMGLDRTTKQSTNSPVIFSPDHDTLAEISYFTSLTGSKNVAYVYHPLNSLLVTLDGTDPTKITGFDRRVLYVDGGSLSSTLTMSNGLAAAMTQLGKEELQKTTPVRAIDGQIPQNTQYRYGIEYNLGDLVEMRNDEGVTSFMRVTEHIYASDDQGDRSYPTVAENRFIVPGSWDAFDISTTWDTVDAAATWNTI